MRVEITRTLRGTWEDFLILLKHFFHSDLYLRGQLLGKYPPEFTKNWVYPSLGLWSHDLRLYLNAVWMFEYGIMNFWYFSGALIVMYDLKSNGYIPDRLLKQIDHRTSQITENGLTQFYASFGGFYHKLRIERSKIHDIGDSFSIGQIIVPIIIYFLLAGIALIVFCGEIIVSKYRKNWISFILNGNCTLKYHK